MSHTCTCPHCNGQHAAPVDNSAAIRETLFEMIRIVHQAMHDCETGLPTGRPRKAKVA